MLIQFAQLWSVTHLAAARGGDAYETLAIGNEIEQYGCVNRASGGRLAVLLDSKRGRRAPRVVDVLHVAESCCSVRLLIRIRLARTT